MAGKGATMSELLKEVLVNKTARKGSARKVAAAVGTVGTYGAW